MFTEDLPSQGDGSLANQSLDQFEQAVRACVGENRYSLWLSSPTYLRSSEEGFVIECPSTAHRQWIDRNLRAELLRCAKAVRGAAATIQLTLAAPQSVTLSPPTTISEESPSPLRIDHAPAAAGACAASAPTLDPEHVSKAVETSTRAATRRSKNAETGASGSQLSWQQRRWTFSAFEEGDGNRLAIEAAREAARSPGRYSPLVLYGPVGCGKTHLLHAIAQEMRSTGSVRRILHVTAEQFTTQFLEALQQRQSPGFRHKFRSIDALLVDDIEFLSGKHATLAELLSTLDALHQRGGQAVVTCAEGSAQLQQLSGDLASRAAAGLAVAIQLPEYSARLAIVCQTAKRCQLTLGSGVAELVAQRIVGSARLLAGALNRLAAVSMAERRPIDRGLAEEAIDAYRREHAPQVRLVDIQRVVCEVFGVEPQTLKSSCRTQAVANPRMLAMWLARKYTRAALSEIGDFFGRRSHSTVVSAQHKVDRLVSQKSEIVVADRPCRIEDALHRLEVALRIA